MLPDCRGPYYILAHSTGSLIGAARRALAGQPRPPHGAGRAVLHLHRLPAVDGGDQPHRRRALLAGLRPHVRRLGRAPAPLAALRDQQADHRHRPLPPQHGALRELTRSWRWAARPSPGSAPPARRSRSCRIRNSSPRIKISDACSSAPAPTRSCRRARSPTMRGACAAAQMLTIDGARHEILQEADIFREQLLAAFDAFVPGNDDGDLSRQCCSPRDPPGPREARPSPRVQLRRRRGDDVAALLGRAAVPVR